MTTNTVNIMTIVAPSTNNTDTKDCGDIIKTNVAINTINTPTHVVTDPMKNINSVDIIDKIKAFTAAAIPDTIDVTNRIGAVNTHHI